MALLDLAAGLKEGEPCEGDLLAAVERALEARRIPGDPAAPRLSAMTVRREGLPEWWTAGGNLLLAPAGLQVRLSQGLGLFASLRNVALLGFDVHPPTLVLPGCDGLIAIGDGARLSFTEAQAFNGSATMIGEHTTAAFFAQMNSRNGGAIIVGADGMWAKSVNLVTDDMHAIRNRETGQRINGFGKRITIHRHVWLCDNVAVLGGAQVGADTVVGAQCLVKGKLAANSVYVGSPPRAVRSGITWTREDLP